MKITETIERECCQPGDLEQYKAGYPKSYPLPGTLKYCRHCGQWWGVRGGGKLQRIIVTQLVWEEPAE